MTLILSLLSCFEKSDIEQKKDLNQQEIQKVILIPEHIEGSRPAVHIEQVREKHLDMMLSAYKELEAYYGSVLSTKVQKIRFVGKSSPWKPHAEKRYCIDARSKESTDSEHIYYFANYCRSLSTLLRETNDILYSYIDIQTCSDLCSCVMEKGITLKAGKMDCMTFCQSLGWEVTCSKGNEVHSECCVQ